MATEKSKEILQYREQGLLSDGEHTDAGELPSGGSVGTGAAADAQVGDGHLNGMKGNSFSTPQLGIRAQVQHLKAYASTEPLKGECTHRPSRP